MGTTSGSDDPQPLITTKDAGLAVFLTLCLPLSWLLTPGGWSRVSRFLGNAATRLQSRSTAEWNRRMERILDDRPGLPPPSTLRSSVLAGYVRQYLQYLRELRPGGWRARLQVSGREHIDEALARGKGCILWVAPFQSANLVAKKALHGAGIPITHLSYRFHGPSASRFGQRFINFVKVDPEMRYLRECLVMTDGSEIRHTRMLYDRLGRNAVISITCTSTGARSVASPILGGALPIASGAASLALATDAALLPVFVLRRGPGHFEVIVEERLAIGATDDRHHAVDELIRRFASRIEYHVTRNPEIFTAWPHIQATLPGTVTSTARPA